MTSLEKFLREKVLNPIADNPLDLFPYMQNLGKWENKFNNILYITGISGGGKGFVAKKIANQYPNTIIFELDKFENYPWYKDTKEKEKSVAKGDAIIYAWIDDHFDTRTDFFMNSVQRYQTLMTQLYEYLLDYANTHTGHRFIMEGVQLFCDPCFKTIDKSDSVIIIKTTKVFSMQKNLERPHAIIRNRFHHGIGATKMLQTMEARLKDPIGILAMESDHYWGIDDHPKYDFTDAEDLQIWMSKNFHYDSNQQVLPSVEEMLRKPLGDCHAQTLFAGYFLAKMGYSYRPYFIIEVDKNGQGGMTHSLIACQKQGKCYWFENAWEAKRGLHPIQSIAEIPSIFRKLHREGTWGNRKKYPTILFGTFKGQPGDSLAKIVDRSLD